MRKVAAMVVLLLAACGAPAQEGEETTIPRPVPLEGVQVAAPGGKTRVVSWRDVLGAAPGGVLEYQRAANRLRAAESQRTLAFGELLPSITGWVNHRRVDGTVQATLGDIQEAHFESASLTASFHWEIDPFGTPLRVAAAGFLREAARWEETDAAQGALLLAARGYLELIRSRALVRVAEKVYAESAELAGVVGTRADQGLMLRADALRARSEKSRREGELLRARTRYRLAAARLASLLGWEPTELIEPSETSLPPFRLAGSLEARGWIEKAVARRPEIRRAEERLKEAVESQRALDWSAVLPRVAAEFQDGTLGNHLGTDQGNRQVVLLGLKWSFLDNLGLAARERHLLAEARVTDARLALEEARRRAAVDTMSALQEVDLGAARNRAAHEENAAAEEALSITRVRSRHGLSLLVDELQQEEALERSRTALVDSLVDYDVAQMELLRAAGELNGAALEGLVPASSVPGAYFHP